MFFNKTFQNVFFGSLLSHQRNKEKKNESSFHSYRHVVTIPSCWEITRPQTNCRSSILEGHPFFDNSDISPLPPSSPLRPEVSDPRLSSYQPTDVLISVESVFSVVAGKCTWLRRLVDLKCKTKTFLGVTQMLQPSASKKALHLKRHW